MEKQATSYLRRNWTLKEVERLKVLRKQGKMYKDIAKLLNRSETAVRIKALTLTPEERKRPHCYDVDLYALYRKDELLLTGTINEIAKSLNTLPSNIAWYLTPTYLNRTSENARRLVKLDDEEEIE